VRPDSVRPDDTAVSERTPIPWKRVFVWLLPYWGAETLLLVGMIGGIGLSLVYPWLMKSIVDDVLTAQQYDRLLPLAGLMLAATAGGVVLSGAASWLSTWVTSRVLIDLRLAMFRHLQRLGPAFFSRRRLGDVLSRMGGDLGELQSVATGTLLNVLGSAITLVAVVSALSVLQPKLLLIGAAFLPFAIGMLLGIRAFIRRLSLRIRERNADISHHMLESLQAIRAVRAHGLSEREASTFGAHNEALVRAVLQMRVLNAASGGLFQILVTANLLAVLVFGVDIVRDGGMSVGELLAFLLFQQRVYGPLQGLSGTYVSLQKASAPIARVFEVLDARPPLALEGTNPVDGWGGGVAFEGLSFAYSPGRPVLHDVSLAVDDGTTVAVVGPSGVGKSTLIDLLFGWVPPQRGTVRIGGAPLNEIDVGAVLPQVALVGQQPALFSGSLRDNLRWLAPDRPDAALDEALDAVSLSDWVASLPEGLDTPLGDRGIRLSAGQRQRIGLARAFLRDPTLLVLDEVTAALDWATDARVLAALDARRQRGRTTLVITHRLNLADRADRVFVLIDGRVVQQGAPADLRAADGPYQQLWALQRGDSD